MSGPPGVAAPLRLVFCADLRCAQPTVVTTEARTIPAAVTRFAPLAITVRPDGRPVVAYLDLPNGVVGVLSCDAVACLRPTMATPARVPAEGVPFFGLTPARLSLVVPPDGRPVLTLPDARTAAPSLIACQTPDCGRATVRSLSGLQPWITGPALTLDPAGLPVVAFRDNSVPGIALVGCEHLGCARVGDRLRFGPTATLEGTVDVAIGADGVPVVVWSDSSGLLLLTCGDRHCRGR